MDLNIGSTVKIKKISYLHVLVLANIISVIINCNGKMSIMIYNYDFLQKQKVKNY